MELPQQAPVGGTVHDVAVEVLRHGPLPRGALARRLGLSAGSLTRLSKPLITSGLLVEAAAAVDPESRRPTRPLDVPADRHRFVGVDLTGSAAWAVVTDLRARVLSRGDAPLPDRSPAAVVEVAALLVERLLAEEGVRADAVGVSLGGYVTPGGVVRRAPFLRWDQPVDLGALLEARLGRQVVLTNDLAAMTATEHWFGEGRGTTSFAVLTIGAGVGYGLVQHDQVVNTPDTGLQLLGHHPLDSSGPRCPEGHRGCATALVTLPALELAGSLALARRADAHEVLALAAAGDPRARCVVDDAARHVGTLVAAVANFTTVERILLTGDGIELARTGERALHEGIAAARDPDASAVDLVLRPHHFEAWARGAAGAAISEYVAGPEWLAMEEAGAEAAHL
ncbi:ROK family transcriptional regulator [Quadrisphaera sp. INWT6]|uniref:ROK family transcriptional regulator n=1 Tax=Quadrisphaera sp. INWT6 TaxID=2596917 RepID=UPI001892180C|nr:ROK family transcriptional regulator [Quadrisphaera sp. INWT6]MBF5082418.1 ROK family transcriptional regulator [Quadrisphaera sp. INWT6]